MDRDSKLQIPVGATERGTRILCVYTGKTPVQTSLRLPEARGYDTGVSLKL
jgi:hypothetical protein